MIGARVRQVRELLGRTQVELSEATTIPQPTISGIEAGVSATDEQIARIAGATGFPVGWFYKPIEYGEFSEGTISFRKKAAASKRQDRCAIRRLEIAYEIVHDLLEDSTLRTPSVTIPYLGRPDSLEAIEHAAQQTRQLLNQPARGPIRNLVRAAERGGALVIGLPVELGGSSRLRNHHGVSTWPDMAGRPIIGFSTADPGDRQRHTIAHEIGHLVLHDIGGGGTDHEAEASQFAAALLMPYADAAEAFDNVPTLTLRYLAELKKDWGISIAGLVMRARQVGRLSDERVTSLFKQISARGWRTNEPVTVHREQPALFVRLLEAHFGEPLDWAATAEALDLPPHLLKEIALVGARDSRASDESANVIVDLAARRAARA